MRELAAQEHDVASIICYLTHKACAKNRLDCGKI